MMVLGGMNWCVQEWVLPTANQRQDATRDLIRNLGVKKGQPIKYWIYSGDRIYSFGLANPPASDNDEAGGSRINFEGSPIAAASDNDKQYPRCVAGCVKDLSVYQFDNSGTSLQSVYRAKNAVWQRGRVVFIGSVERSDLREGRRCALSAPVAASLGAAQADGDPSQRLEDALKIWTSRQG